MGVVPWVISALIASLPYLFFAIGGKSWNPQNHIENVHKGKYTKKIYKEYDVDLSKVDSLEEEKRRISDSK